MNAKQYRLALDRALRALRPVLAMLRAQGIPVTEAQRWEMAMQMVGPIQQSRSLAFNAALAYLAAQGFAPEVGVPKYPVVAVVDMLQRIVDNARTPDDKPVNRLNRRDTLVVEQIGARIVRGAERHAQQPARDLVQNVANEWPGVAWARVLTGARSCYFCAMLASRGPVYTSETAAKYRGGERVDTYHDGCVVAGTRVSGPVAHTGYRRHYEGGIIQLATAAGYELTITPKHPVLTGRGWVPAGDLNVGDQLVSPVGVDGDVMRGPNEYQVPARIENVVGALDVMASSRRLTVPGTAEQFHGDGFDSEVDVVTVNDLFRNEFDTALIEPMSQLDFHRTALPCSFGSPDCPGVGELSLFSPGFGASGRSFMGGSELVGSLVGGHGGGAELASAAAVADRHARVAQPIFYGGAGNAGGVADRKRAFAGLVATDDLVDKRVGVFHGEVFNLSTSDGWYNANGITVSNCDCEVVLVQNYTTWEGRRAHEALAKLWEESTVGTSGRRSMNAFRRAYEAQTGTGKFRPDSFSTAQAA